MSFYPFLSLFSFETLVCESYSVYFQIGSLKQSSPYFFYFYYFFFPFCCSVWVILTALSFKPPVLCFFIWSATELHQWILQFTYCILQLFDFGCAFLYFLRLCKFVFVITYCFPKFNPFYDHKF